MKKQLILLFSLFPLGLSLLVAPTYCDYTSETSTSVTDDLTSLNFDYTNLNYDDPTLLTMALSDDNQVFLYFYVPGDRSDISFYRVTTINFCDSDEVDAESEYVNETSWVDVTLLSNNTTYNINKYVIDDYSVNSSDKYFRWYVSQFQGQIFYNNHSYNDSKIGSYTEVLYDLNNLKYVTNKIQIITITDKLVAFDLVYLTDQTLFNQSSYVAFNTDYQIDDLIKIDCGFDNTFVTGSTDCIANGDPTLFETSFKGYDSLNSPIIVESNSIRKYVVNTSYEINSAYWFNVFDKRSYKWDTIQKTSELANATDEVKKYEWCVHFQNSKFKAEPMASSTPIHLYGISTADSTYDVEFPSDYNNFSYVTNFEIFNLWFEENGEIKQAVVIDTPTDSSGHDQTTDPVVEDWWSKFVDWFLADPFTHALYIVGAIITLPILITLLPYLIKLIILIIKLPFKLISGLIKAFHK